MQKHISPSVFKLSATGLAALALFSLSADAALILYEGFDYGGSNAALNAVNGSALGLAGTSYTGSPGDYVSTGLTFTNLQTTGGSASLVGVGSANRAIRRQLDTGNISGTIYGSFLFQQTAVVNDSDFLGVGFGPGDATDNTAEVIFLTDQFSNNFSQIRANPSNAGSAPYSASGTVAAPAPPTPVTLGLFEITNVGAVSGVQSVTFWILTEAQYVNFRLDGLTTSELNSASVGSGTTDVFERITLTINGTSGYINVGNSDYLNLLFRNGTYNVDEIRLSNANWNEVTPIPEPSAVALLGFCGVAMIVFRSRQRKFQN